MMAFAGGSIDIVASGQTAVEIMTVTLLDSLVVSAAPEVVKDSAIPYLTLVHKLNDVESLDPKEKNLLVSSPYPDRAHLLDLRSVDQQCGYMARALTTMNAISAKYATLPYSEAFNWSDVMAKLESETTSEGFEFPETSFYVVVFRSQVPLSADRSRLGELDIEAHREAVESRGLLKYWFGIPNADGRNLATCIWRNRQDAKLGGAGKGHAQAMQEARGLYLEWKVERLRLVVHRGAKSLEIVPWTD